MSRKSEESLWRDGRSRILRDFTRDMGRLLSTAADRGFSTSPGFVKEGAALMERDAKLKLAELNQRIVAGEIERETKNVALQYENQIKEYRLQWEADKQELIREMQMYLSELKRMQNVDSEDLEREAIEVERQRIVILEAETDIKSRMEGYNQELATAKSETNYYERQLIESKISILRKKEELIPVLLSLVEAEETALNRTASELIPTKREYLAMLETLVANKETLVTLQVNLSQRESELVEGDIAIAGKEGTLSDKRLEVGAKATQVANAEKNLLEKQATIIAKSTTVLDAQKATMNQEKSVSTSETAVYAKESLIAESRKANASAERSLSENEKNLAEKDKSLSAKDITVSESQMELANRQSEVVDKELFVSKSRFDYLTRYKDAVATMLDTSDIRKQIAEKNYELTKQEKDYLDLRKQILEARNGVRELEIDYLLAGMGYDKDIAIYRAQTQLNASTAKSKTLVGNSDSAGISINPESGGTFSSESTNIAQARNDIRSDAFNNDMEMKRNKLAYEKERVEKDIEAQVTTDHSGTYAKSLTDKDGHTDSFVEIWGVKGAIAANEASRNAAERLAAKLSSRSRIESTLNHVLGSDD